ncbi:MAG: S9 family peptidase, partial [Erysipelotrichaceae bacterium]|nr:S9 family peptidase [Erysipelotrichaceae bacterium]
EVHTDRFCAIASQRSISNWIGFTYVSDIGPNFSADQNSVTDFRSGIGMLWEHSPLKYVDAARTPILFIHSDEDYRCPLEEGMQMFQALTVRGVETRMVIFHGENHELSRSGKPEHRIRRLREITDWFNKHAKN